MLNNANLVGEEDKEEEEEGLELIDIEGLDGLNLEFGNGNE